jgi:hypothetical protein
MVLISHNSLIIYFLFCWYQFSMWLMVIGVDGYLTSTVSASLFCCILYLETATFIYSLLCYLVLEIETFGNCYFLALLPLIMCSLEYMSQAAA